MIYLIGGAPRLGKSLVATRLGALTGARIIRTDELHGVAERALSAGVRRMRFPYVGFSGNPAENTASIRQRLAWQDVEAASLAPFLRQTLEEAIARREDVILEGVHVTPALARGYVYGGARCLFIGSTSVARVLAGLRVKTSHDSWLSPTNEPVTEQVAAYVVAWSAQLFAQAQSHALPIFERSDDFDGDLRRACALMFGSGRGVE